MIPRVPAVQSSIYTARRCDGKTVIFLKWITACKNGSCDRTVKHLTPVHPNFTLHTASRTSDMFMVQWRKFKITLKQMICSWTAYGYDKIAQPQPGSTCLCSDANTHFNNGLHLLAPSQNENRSQTLEETLCSLDKSCFNLSLIYSN